MTKRKRRTHEDYVKELKEIHPNIEPMEEFKGVKSKLKHRCLICGSTWEATPSDLLYSCKYGCHKCALNGRALTRTRSHEDYVKELQNINQNIVPLEKYKGNNTKIKHRCLICGFEWDVQPANLLCGHGCPRCSGKEHYTTESFKEKLKEINPNIEVIGEYVNNRTKIKCRCLIDGYEWNAKPAHLLHGGGCHMCVKAGESYMQRFIYYSFKQVYNNVLYRSYALIGMELDIIIPDIKLALEPGSWYWHKDKTERDLEKRRKAIAKGYNIITIYDNFKELEKPYEDCITFDKDLHEDDKHGGKLLENYVKDLFRQLGIEQEVDFDKVREECK